VIGDERFELAREFDKALGERRRRVRLDLPVGEMPQAVALGRDQSPAGRAETRVEAEDFYLPLPPAGGARGGVVREDIVMMDMPSPCPSRKREGS
jgi:hypothetical protein